MAGGAVQHLICGGLVAVAMLVPACASATILTRCGSLADLQPLADASTLPAEEQAALATVRSAAEATITRPADPMRRRRPSTISIHY